ncbi:Flagellar motility protein MotE, a chaperone for MotC folding [Devosia sp. YR412]|uniref:MotE family protein n=1 Tax=Devosia sp. YR412 TaxID=1881030 RepID=UPI0008BA8A68|nr:hypothetical protein [Devosia sp. YR412]SEP98528.1 Flagellar motility protein MotE, a chaperone for MotC folding [Devosia sp. YR412]
MTKIRLLPVLVLAIAALLVLKTLGLVTNGGYVLTGVGVARASGAASGGGEGGGTTEADQTITPAAEPTLEDTSPTLDDTAPTIGGQPAAAGGGHGAPAAEAAPAADHGAAPAEGAAAATPVAAHTTGTYCVEADATITDSGEAVLNENAGGAAHGAAAAEPEAEAAPAGDHAEPAVEGEAHAEVAPAPGSFAASMIDCLPSGDAVPTELGPDGQPVPINASSSASATEQQLLDRLVARRTELQQYEADLALRASIVDAAEKRIEERATTLEALENQISTLVDQRQEMEAGQFASIVAMYENMRPKDAATIFNNLDMAVLLQVAKTMAPRKMAPILAAMDAPRAQELTVAMANLAEQPPTQMTPDDLAALPQIVGQ